MNVIEEMEQYAKEYNIPIMQQEGIDFMCAFIEQHKCTRILEIGSAIGYSAIRMAMIHSDVVVVTIERDEERFVKAKEYVEESGYEQQITLCFGDALETEIEGQFDLLFIDAAKAQYIKFFERYERNVKKGGFIITDNLGFHGLVDHQELAHSRNLRQLLRKIQGFVDYLKQREEYETTFLKTGDGIGISRKK